MTRPGEFDELYDRMYAPAERLARRLVGLADAEDVTVEAFARTLARWGKVGHQPFIDAWVLRVTTNVALDRLRHERRHPLSETAPRFSRDDETALRVTLQAALRVLPRRQGEVITLRYLADMNENDVATVLGLSLGTVKTHSRRGLAALRLRLGDEREVLFHAG